MLRRTTLVVCAVSLVIGLVVLSRYARRERTAVASGTAPAAAQAKTKLSVMRMPLAFEANRGQMDPQALYRARSRGGSVFITSTGATFMLPGDPPEDARLLRPGIRTAHKAGPRREPVAFRMKVVGASGAAKPGGKDELPGKVNYFIGDNPSKWHTDIPTFAKVFVAGVYPGVDLIYYGNEGHLEYDFVVAPGADPDSIRVEFEGVDRLRVNESGDLVVAVGDCEVIQRQPRVYQENAGYRHDLGSAYVILQNHFVTFRVIGRDPQRPLVIDPAIGYSTFIGGSFEDGGLNVAVDGTGNSYITGSAISSDFPTTAGAYQTVNKGTPNGSNAFVAKFNPTGALLYSTYLGGSSSDVGLGIALDSSGDAYFTGTAGSTNFPTVNPLQISSAGSPDVFVAKLSAAGDRLIFSTYLGGSNADRGNGIAVDSNGNAYITGCTMSSDFRISPIPNPIQDSYGGEGQDETVKGDAFVAKLSSTGTTLVYSTFLGGSNGDCGNGIAVDRQGNSYVVGTTVSSDFPTEKPFQAVNQGYYNVFLAKVNPAGSALVYSTYLGGSKYDWGNGIAVDDRNSPYLTGQACSSDFPTAPTYNMNVGCNAFAGKFSSGGDSLVYLSYFGSSSASIGVGIALDVQGNAYLVGRTPSRFPTVNPVQASYGGGNHDVFIAKLNLDGSALVYSSYLGGSADEYGAGIAVDLHGDAYVVGSTYSSSFPTSTNAYQAQKTFGAGSFFPFVVKLSAPLLILSGVSPSSGSALGGTKVTLTGQNFLPGTVVLFGTDPATDVSVDPTGTSITARTPPHALGPVDVTVRQGADMSVLPNGYTYLPFGVSSITPTSGSSIGGTQVTIAGDHFVPGCTVLFGQLPAETVTVVDSTTIVATTPSQVAATVDVTVTTPDSLSATLPAAYTYWTQQPRAACGCDAGAASPALLLALAGLGLLRLRRRTR